jgi:thiol-disulfide isomerase/thioredoxin
MQTMMLTVSGLWMAMIFGTTGNEPGAVNTKLAPSLNGATGWLNTQPLKLSGLRGKVVLVDFWTFTCINWRRTLPYIREWEKKYKEKGLVVIGVHTPEFLFEHKQDNISRSLKEMNISYPVAIDNEHEIWRSFNNNYWPALYLIDAKGMTRFQKFGEGDYEQIELQIRQLLNEPSGKTIYDPLAAPIADGAELQADWEHLGSSENFLGYNRTEGFASPEEMFPDKRKMYAAPAQLQLNQWALSGDWIMGEENVTPAKDNGKIIYRFHARDLHLIMGPSKPGSSIKYRVLIDEKAPGTSHGLDIDSNGYGTVTEHRMYQLIRQQGPIDDRVFQIEFFQTGVEVFDFTFG